MSVRSEWIGMIVENVSRWRLSRTRKFNNSSIMSCLFNFAGTHSIISFSIKVFIFLLGFLKVIFV